MKTDKQRQSVAADLKARALAARKEYRRLWKAYKALAALEPKKAKAK